MDFMDFTTHPAEHNMTYLEHFLRSSRLSFSLGVGSLKALVHAVFPEYFQDSSTRLAKELHAELLV